MNCEQKTTLQLLSDTAEEFALREVAPLAKEVDENNRFPRELWPKFGEMGLLGITAEEAYGGANMGYLAHVMVIQQISRQSGSIGLSYAAHSNLSVNQLTLHGTRAQKEQYLPRLISGEWVGALAMSEAHAGSDVMSMRLRAQKTDAGYRLNGHKMWITNGPDADLVIVYAKTGSLDSKEITAFLVETSMPGFKVAQKLDKLGMRGSNTCELLFEDCEVPDENILGQVDEGTRVLMRGLDYERVLLAAGPLGLMQACHDLVFPYVKERKQFGRAIGEFQLIQAKIADMYVQFQAARSYLYHVASACDNNQITRKDAAAVILYCSELATQMALQAIQALGGNGYINDYPAGRLLRDAKLYEIGAGTSEIRRMLIGRELMSE